MVKRKLNILGVIGLRSGSKGIKDKNIKKFDGKPLFVRILNSAHKSKYLTRTIISTDSLKYAKIAKNIGVTHLIFDLKIYPKIHHMK